MISVPIWLLVVLATLSVYGVLGLVGLALLSARCDSFWWQGWRRR